MDPRRSDIAGIEAWDQNGITCARVSVRALEQSNVKREYLRLKHAFDRAHR
jgi:hypothetical protein